MKRTIISILLLLVSVSFCFAQTITLVKINHSNYWSSNYHILEPDYHPEPGSVVVDITVDNRGYVKRASIREKETTVNNAEQIESALYSSKNSFFKMMNNAPDSLDCMIKFTFKRMSQVQVDSLQLAQLQAINKEIQSLRIDNHSPKYIIYPTDNLWTFIELDTEFGWLYQVQYSLKGDDYRFKVPISYEDLRVGSRYHADDVISGRFELYKTQNMYNFILLDKIDGRTWQVQWSMEKENRFVRKIDF